MKGKVFNRIFFLITIFGLVLFALPTIVIDPLFHYHAPLAGLAYPLDDERYQNDGIVRHFEYDALITGTSMTENFMTSELDALFGTNAIKVSFAGGLYKEINDNVLVALDANPGLRMVVRSVDLAGLISDKDAPYPAIEATNYIYPWYLLDDNPFNDVSYFLNKSVFFEKTWEVARRTWAGEGTTSFDSYARWEEDSDFGKEAVLATYTRPEPVAGQIPLSDTDIELLQGNLRQNVIDTALAYPDVTFYLFIPPYSVSYWDAQLRNGLFQRDMDAMELAIRELVEIPNIRLYAFGDREDIVGCLDHYRDWTHYGAGISSEILRCMKAGEGLLTKENHSDYMNEIRAFYAAYDYDSLYR